MRMGVWTPAAQTARVLHASGLHKALRHCIDLAVVPLGHTTNAYLQHQLVRRDAGGPGREARGDNDHVVLQRVKRHISRSGHVTAGHEAQRLSNPRNVLRSSTQSSRGTSHACAHHGVHADGGYGGWDFDMANMRTCSVLARACRPLTLISAGTFGLSMNEYSRMCTRRPAYVRPPLNCGRPRPTYLDLGGHFRVVHERVLADVHPVARVRARRRLRQAEALLQALDAHQLAQRAHEGEGGDALVVDAAGRRHVPVLAAVAQELRREGKGWGWGGHGRGCWMGCGQAQDRRVAQVRRDALCSCGSVAPLQPTIRCRTRRPPTFGMTTVRLSTSAMANA